MALMMEAARTSETSVNNYFTWQYIPEDISELCAVFFKDLAYRAAARKTVCG